MPRLPQEVFGEISLPQVPASRHEGRQMRKLPSPARDRAQAPAEKGRERTVLHLPCQGEGRTEPTQCSHGPENREVHLVPQPARLPGEPPPEGGRPGGVLPVPQEGGVSAEGGPRRPAEGRMQGMPPSSQLRRAGFARQGEDAAVYLLSRSRKRRFQEIARELSRGIVLLHGMPRPALLFQENASQGKRAQSRVGEKLRRVPPVARFQDALRGDGKRESALFPVPR
jgi:hypothetical protein